MRPQLRTSSLLDLSAKLRQVMPLLLLAGLLLPRSTRADDNRQNEPLALLPPTTLLYSAIPRPTGLIDQVLTHPLVDKLQKLPVYNQVLNSPQVVQGRTVGIVIAANLGSNWRGILETFAGNGIYAAIDGETRGLAILAHSPQPDQRAVMLKKLIEMGRADAKGKGQDDPYEQKEYRGLTAMRAGDAIFVELGPWLVVANNGDLARSIADRWIDKSDVSLSQHDALRTIAQTESQRSWWAYVDIERLRESGAAKDLFPAQSKDIAAEFLLGGIYANLLKTNQLTAAIDIKDTSVALHVETPHDPTWVSDARTFYWGPGGDGEAPRQLPAVTDQLFALGVYRNISSLWVRSADLFNQKVVDELANADSGLSNLFGGRDFGDEILGAFHPEIQIIVARQKFAESAPIPAVQLPAFAAVLQMKEPQTMRPELRRTFQSVIGFANVAGASQGQPQLEMDMEKSGEAEFVFAKYLPPKEQEKATNAATNFNFTPSIGFVGDQCVLSSSAALARELVDILRQPTTDQPIASAPNLWGALTFATLRGLAADNRDSLVSKNQLEKGHSKAQAEQEVDTLLSLIELFHAANLQLDTDSSRMLLDVNLTF